MIELTIHLLFHSWYLHYALDIFDPIIVKSEKPSIGLTHRKVLCSPVIKNRSVKTEGLELDSSRVELSFFLCSTLLTSRITSFFILYLFDLPYCSQLLSRFCLLIFSLRFM